MGKLTLLIVFAAILGASMLSFSVRAMNGETGRARSETQASLLARQIAESGRGVVLSDVTVSDGFKTAPSFGGRDYNGGEFLVSDYRTFDERMKASFTVRGEYGGASHTIRNTYMFDPMDYPGPIWIDVPYATTTVSGQASVSGGGVAGADIYVDKKKFEDYGVAALGMSLASTTTQLRKATRGGVQIQNAYDVSTLTRADGQSVVADLGLSQSPEDLYWAAINAKGAGDQTFTPDAGSDTYEESGTVTWGGENKVTHVDGGLLITGRVTGSGALVVGGSLDVPGRLDWKGLVIVRSEEDFNRVRLNGRVTIEGSLAIAQDAYPPGGHVDVTVMRDPSGTWANPWGSKAAGPGALKGSYWPAADPFLMHVHKFDEIAGTRTVQFANKAAGDPHELGTRLRELLNHLGSQQVQIELANAENHGQGLFTFDLSDKDPVRGAVAHGFEPVSFAHEGNTFRTQPFRASDLDAFSIKIQSLLRLKKLWDSEGSCADGSWPTCVGKDAADRRDALTVRLVKTSTGKVLYEAAIYWHFQEGERENYLTVEIPQWQQNIQNGAFGTAIELGKNVKVTYKLDPIADLAQKLRFDGNQVHLLETEVVHETVDEARAENPWVCHNPGKNNQQSLQVGPDALTSHLRHGDTQGPCAAGNGNGNGNGNGGLLGGVLDTVGDVLGGPDEEEPPAFTCQNPNAKVKVCRPPSGGDSSWNDVEMKCENVAAYLAAHPGAMAGTCSDNNAGNDDDDD